jgi:hypothetical protein
MPEMVRPHLPFRLLPRKIKIIFGVLQEAQRISVVGKTEKDIDLDIFSPVTQKRAFVQVKSSTSMAQIREYYDSFIQYKQYDEMYFVFHSMSGLTNDMGINDSKLHLWGLSRVAELVIHAGLVEWLIAKRS